MTLTELKYIVAVARERHFGRAAEACFVSQPTLSIAVRKLEEELGVLLFERGGIEVAATPVGERIIVQAQKVLEETILIRELAKHGRDPLAGPLRVGIIHTIGPYLLPQLIPQVIARTPQMPLVLQETFTVKLLELLRQGDIDCAILALPLPDSGLVVDPLYEEPFVVAVPKIHPWAQRSAISSLELRAQTMLLLGAGHCFRDQVLEVCPEMSRFAPESEGIQRTFEGSSLETIRHMVASGIGITVMPITAVPVAQLPRSYQTASPHAKETTDKSLQPQQLLAYIPFSDPLPKRTVALVWRRSFTRLAALDALKSAVQACDFAGVIPISDQKCH